MNWQSNVVDPVLHVVVVGFHHKKGCQIEYAYPPLMKGNSVESSECPRKWRHLPSLALPDGAHNFSEDTVYFHLPSLDESETTIFGVSCCRQIDANEVLNRNEDVTRNTIQKSVCVLSRLPVFGLIQVKLEMITHAYFKGRDFTRVKLLEETYQTLNSSLTESLLQNSHIYLGLSGRQLLRQFRHKLVILFKLLLLERKVLFFSSPVKPICTGILSIASLFPGLIEQGLFESARFHAAVLTPSPTANTAPLFCKVDDDNFSPLELGGGVTENDETSLQEKECGNNSQNVVEELVNELIENSVGGVVENSKNDDTHQQIHADRNSENLSSSLQQLSRPQQQRWQSTTLSQLHSRFFSSLLFSNKNNNTPPQSPLTSTSLPSVESNVDEDKVSLEGNSIFYGDILPPKKVVSFSTNHAKPSNKKNENNSDDIQNNNDSVIFIPTQSVVSDESNKSKDSSLSNKLSSSLDRHSSSSQQAPIHFSPPTTPSNHLPLCLDKCRPIEEVVGSGCSRVSLSSNIVAATAYNNPTLADTFTATKELSFTSKNYKSSKIVDEIDFNLEVEASANLEDMLDGDDDDDGLVWRDEQHRLEISEIPEDCPTVHESEDINMRYNADIDRGYNADIDRGYNADINRGYNADINRGYNADIDRGYNTDIKDDKSHEDAVTRNKNDRKSSESVSLFTTDDCGLPLQIFSKGVLCHPYLSLHLYDMLTDPNVRGFVIGATNALFKQRKQLLDVIVELGESKIDIMDNELKRCLTLSTADLRFADILVRNVTQERGDPFLDNTGWEGGDDWIRSQFRSYLMSLLATVNYGDERAEDDFNASFVAAWKTTNNYKMWMKGGPYSSLSSLPPRHLCHGQLSMSDVRLKINQVINNGGREKKISSVVNQTVSQTGRAVGAAVTLAKSTVSNWFVGFSSKE